jgi:predicted RNA-binding protein Jag
MRKILEATVVIYFRDITTTLGIPIAVLVHHDSDEVDLRIRTDWQPVLAYDESAELEFLQELIREIAKHKQDAARLTILLAAENSVRAEKLAGTDPLLAQKLTEVIHNL